MRTVPHHNNQLGNDVRQKENYFRNQGKNEQKITVEIFFKLFYTIFIKENFHFAYIKIQNILNHVASQFF